MKRREFLKTGIGFAAGLFGRTKSVVAQLAPFGFWSENANIVPLRVTQMIIAAVGGAGAAADVRTSQVILKAAATNTDGNLQTSQLILQAATSNLGGELRTTQTVFATAVHSGAGSELRNGQTILVVAAKL